jgi:hypothetical protein
MHDGSVTSWNSYCHWMKHYSAKPSAEVHWAVLLSDDENPGIRAGRFFIMSPELNIFLVFVQFISQFNGITYAKATLYTVLLDLE